MAVYKLLKRWNGKDGTFNIEKDCSSKSQKNRYNSVKATDVNGDIFYRSPFNGSPLYFQKCFQNLVYALSQDCYKRLLKLFNMSYRPSIEGKWEQVEEVLKRYFSGCFVVVTQIASM